MIAIKSFGELLRATANLSLLCVAYRSAFHLNPTKKSLLIYPPSQHFKLALYEHPLLTPVSLYQWEPSRTPKKIADGNMNSIASDNSSSSTILDDHGIEMTLFDD